MKVLLYHGDSMYLTYVLITVANISWGYDGHAPHLRLLAQQLGVGGIAKANNKIENKRARSLADFVPDEQQ